MTCAQFGQKMFHKTVCRSLFWLLRKMGVRGGLNKFHAFERGGLNRGFTVFQACLMGQGGGVLLETGEVLIIISETSAVHHSFFVILLFMITVIMIIFSIQVLVIFPPQAREYCMGMCARIGTEKMDP